MKGMGCAEPGNQSIGLYRGRRTAQNGRMSPDCARAFWVVRPGQGEIRPETLAEPLAGQVVVRAEYSGISRGTEALVFNGQVPATEWDRMRAPFQAGRFPGPVKYGYSSVGVVDRGPQELVGRRVFALYPHQTRYVVSADDVYVLPDGVPSGRAVLAANLETALNGVWDAELQPASTVTVIGGGVVGCLVAWVAKQTEGCQVVLIDKNPDRAAVARALGVTFETPARASSVDVVIHASASAEGLDLALSIANFEGTVVEMSWYGDREVPVRLGGSFHSQRLTLKSSQVGTIARRQRAEWNSRQRLERAIELLADPALDVLITGESAFDELPGVMAHLAIAPPGALCHRITYV
jgi:2-desacetyl-2-hydroxyethyl bacteriochlorophyllide A dehydrogenase